MGKIGSSWALMKQSFQILRTDKQLMMLPIFSAISCLLVTGLIALGGGLMVFPYVRSSLSTNQDWHPGSPMLLGALFVFYVANYFVIVFFNTALVGAASIRLGGGTPTLKDGWSLAWERKGVIFQWAILAATVGVILKVIEGRMRWIGQLVAGLIGVAWTLASYFVVPVIAFENLGPFDALKRSAQLFRKNWGEKVVAGFSFGLIFFLFGLLGLLLPVAGAMLARGIGFAVGLGLMIVYFVLLAVTSAATQGIFVAALYRFANTGQASRGFRAENFSMAWQTK
jgi:hypothetical protein